jgi:hypothetical protein
MTDMTPPTQETEAVAPGEVDSLQAVARWLVGGAAAVLAALVASVQLSSLADVASSGLEVAIQVLGLTVVALAAVGSVLILAARVLIQPGWTLAKLSTVSLEPKWDKHWLKEELDIHRSMILPDVHGTGTATTPPTVNPPNLAAHHLRLLRAWIELHETGTSEVKGNLLDVTDNRKIAYDLTKDHDVAALDARLQATAGASTRLTSLANLLDIRRRYRRLVKLQLPTLGTIVVIAILGLVWLAAENAEVPITTPVQVDVRFTDDLSQLSESQIPLTCKGLTIRAVAINGTLSTPEVSSISDRQCMLNHAELSTEIATVVPVPPSR